MTKGPRLIRYQPPSPETIAEQRASIEALRAEIAHEREQSKPARRAAIAAGPELRDLDAAVDCHCSCHPRPADSRLHEGGVKCSCQLTVEERRINLDKFFSASEELYADETFTKRERQRDEDVTRAIEALGVEVDQIGGMAPFVITGRVDGRGFYLRERHEHYRIVIAPDSDPAADVWSAPIELDHIEVCSGDASDLDGPDGFNPAEALTFTVNQIRLFMQRRNCAHTDALRFCPHCGIETVDAARWRHLE